MKHKNHLNHALLIVIIAAALGFLAIGFFYFDLRSELIDYRESAENNLSKLNANIDDLNEENEILRETISEIKGDYSDLKNEYSNLENASKIIKSQVLETLDKLYYFKTEINDSLAWYKNNSNLSGKIKGDYVKKKLLALCYENEEDACKIKLACFELINMHYLGLSYIPDYYSTGKYDRILSLEEFYENDGGDCEDYSLYYKAEFNSVLENCEEKDMDIEAWDYEAGDKYWVDFDEDWYIEDAKPFVLPEGYIYPSIICGRFRDSETDIFEGHCIIGFTKQKIKDADDLRYLDKAPMVEPQIGYYMGEINSNESETYMPDHEDYKYKSSSVIELVITDTDFYFYSDDYSEWMSYSLFDEEISGFIASLEESVR